jgi:hypothetical protein
MKMKLKRSRPEGNSIRVLARPRRPSLSTGQLTYGSTASRKIPLNAIPFTERGGDIPESIPSAQLRALLALGHRLILEAPAGAGKTTTLVQLAQAEASDNGIPFLIDLPNLVTSSSPSDILQYLASSPAFRSRGVDAAALARLSQDTTFLFLLNGWNEIAKLYSQAAEQALREIDRAFPRAGIMVATRAHHFVPPLPGSARFQLLPTWSTLPPLARCY